MHKFRHTFASRAIRGGISPELVSGVMGTQREEQPQKHKCIRVTKRLRICLRSSSQWKQVWFTVNDRFKQVLPGSNTPNFNLRKHHVTLASYRKD